MEEKSELELKAIIFDCQVERLTAVTRGIMQDLMSLHKFPHASNFIVGGLFMTHSLASNYQTTQMFRPAEDIFNQWLSRKLESTRSDKAVFIVNSPEERDRLINLSSQTYHKTLRVNTIFTPDEIFSNPMHSAFADVQFIYIMGGVEGTASKNEVQSLLVSIWGSDNLNMTDTEIIIFNA